MDYLIYWVVGGLCFAVGAECGTVSVGVRGLCCVCCLTRISRSPRCGLRGVRLLSSAS